jgi:hypothetical protein
MPARLSSLYFVADHFVDEFLAARSKGGDPKLILETTPGERPGFDRSLRPCEQNHPSHVRASSREQPGGDNFSVMLARLGNRDVGSPENRVSELDQFIGIVEPCR